MGLIRMIEAVTAQAQRRRDARAGLASLRLKVAEHVIKCLLLPESNSAGGWKVELIAWLSDSHYDVIVKGGRLTARDLRETLFSVDHPLQIEEIAEERALPLAGLSLEWDSALLHKQVIQVYEDLIPLILAPKFQKPFAPQLERILHRAQQLK